MSIIIKIKGEDDRPKHIPRTCGDCNHCEVVEMFHKLQGIPGTFYSQGFRCTHPHHKARDWKNRTTAIEPTQAPPKWACPLYKGLTVHTKVIYPK